MAEQNPEQSRATLDYQTPQSERPMTPAERRRFERNLGIVRRIGFALGLTFLCAGAGDTISRGLHSDGTPFMVLAAP